MRLKKRIYEYRGYELHVEILSDKGCLDSSHKGYPYAIYENGELFMTGVALSIPSAEEQCMQIIDKIVEEGCD